ncbi:unnamed protein product [Chrysodeixis includens]|uniref:THAP-type domain-containing protein n=1 Tax=Chrysodeixis includens TaxID=689277 RepID=A0A9P0BZ77_CHRIL|nr:unnamed protein product [Chrysodeixis includens]
MAPCTIRLCSNKSQSNTFKENGVTFHRYPKDPDIKSQWVAATRRFNWNPSQYSLVCSQHFTEDCFINLKNRRRLLASAVPTLYLPIVSFATDSDEPKPSTSNPELQKKNDLTSPATTSIPTPKKPFPGNPSDYTTPSGKRLCETILKLNKKLENKNKRLKNLRERTRYLGEKIAFYRKKFRECLDKDF